MITITTWRETYLYRPRADLLRGQIIRRRTPLLLWLFERWYWRAHRVPLLRRLVFFDDWWSCEFEHRLFDRWSDEHRVTVAWEQLSPDYRARVGPRIEAHRARWRKRLAEQPTSEAESPA